MYASILRHNDLGGGGVRFVYLSTNKQCVMNKRLYKDVQ